MRLLVALFVSLAACATEVSSRSLVWPTHAPATGCSTSPALPPAVGFRHIASAFAAKLGEPRHRAIDLVASADAPEQLIAGELGYTALDKELEDEDAEVYACIHDSWSFLGRTRTDEEGHFTLALRGDRRVPVGLHALLVTLPGDRTSSSFTAYVAPRGAQVFVCDIDGTLTESENAIVAEAVWDATVAAKPGAARALSDLARHGYQPVYLSARPRAFSELTRRWLAEHGLPRGPIILQPGLTLPGDAALGAKTHALDTLHAVGLHIAYGIGNRASDIAAYARAGLPAERIWIEDSQYASEIRPLVARGLATRFTGYAKFKP